MLRRNGANGETVKSVLGVYGSFQLLFESVQCRRLIVVWEISPNAAVNFSGLVANDCTNRDERQSTDINSVSVDYCSVQ